MVLLGGSLDERRCRLEYEDYVNLWQCYARLPLQAADVKL